MAGGADASQLAIILASVITALLCLGGVCIYAGRNLIQKRRLAQQQVVFKRDSDAFEGEGDYADGLKSGQVSVPYMARAANHLLGKKEVALHGKGDVANDLSTHSNSGQSTNHHAAGSGRSAGNAPNTIRRMTSWPAHTDTRHKIMATGEEQPESAISVEATPTIPVEATPTISTVAELEERIKNAPAGRANSILSRVSEPRPVAMRWLGESEVNGATGPAMSPDTPATAQGEDEPHVRQPLADNPDTPLRAAPPGASVPIEGSADLFEGALELGDVCVLDDAGLLGDFGLSDMNAPTSDPPMQYGSHQMRVLSAMRKQSKTPPTTGTAAEQDSELQLGDDVLDLDDDTSLDSDVASQGPNSEPKHRVL